MPGNSILLGVIGRPHGVRGLVHVQSYTEDPRALTAYGKLADESGRLWTLAWRRDGVAELRDAAGTPISSRDEAARLTNTKLYIDRDRLPATDEEEYYLSDLVGMAATTPAGAPLGHVLAVHDYGAGTSLELSNGLILPFTQAAVPEVDVAARKIVAVAPEIIEQKPSPDGARPHDEPSASTTDDPSQAILALLSARQDNEAQP